MPLRFGAAALLAAALAGACAGIGNGEEDADELTGVWEWVSSSGGIAGWMHTPESAGYTARLEYDGRGNVRGFRNDSLVAQASYAIRAAVEGEEDVTGVTYAPQLAVFATGPLDEHTVRYLEGDTAVFAEPCCDRYAHVMRRTQ